MKQQKQKKPKIKKEKAPPPSEGELVKKYANRVIKNQIYHGRVDSGKFAGMEHDRSVSKNIWMDTDFYFSVVFQSADQKYEFLQKSGWTIDSDDQIQIVNGLELAKAMGIELKKETTKPYPTGNLDLMPFVLDNEKITDKSE